MALASAALLAGCAGTSSSPTGKVASVPAGVPAIESNVARQGYFYVGGRYVGEPGREVMIGQMYVEVWVPREVRHPYPIVFFHGASSTATTWMQTPDGRRGWAHFFVDQGYIVYLTDQPARGRSIYDVQHQGKQIRANEHVRLEARGIRGNAHGIPSEKNNLVSAKLVDDWLRAKVR